LSFCLDYLALQPTSSVNDVPVTVRYRLVDAQNAPFGAASMVMGTAHHNAPNGGSSSVPAAGVDEGTGPIRHCRQLPRADIESALGPVSA
jgi:hypothetical protein